MVVLPRLWMSRSCFLKIDLTPFAGRFNCRGLAQWRDPDADPNQVCTHSLFLATSDKRLIALDAATGTP